jgi:Zn-finger protein
MTESERGELGQETAAIRQGTVPCLIATDPCPIPETKEYSFFTHRSCEYFPCHQTDDPDNFNCLFCYCPLYFLGAECGGNFQITEKGYKSCTDCLFPHQRENYELITERFPVINAALEL